MIHLVLLTFSGLFLCFLKVNPGADRENTMMDTVSAQGEKLPPMIVFEGSFVQTTWRPNYLPTSGWTLSDIFNKWFGKGKWKRVQLKNRNSRRTRKPSFDIWWSTFTHLVWDPRFARSQKLNIIKLSPNISSFATHTYSNAERTGTTWNKLELPGTN